MSAEIQVQAVPPHKRIALFLDGTWNTVGDNTNVWRLKALCAQRDKDDIRQVAYYSRGVGTTLGEKVRGGVLGVGVDRNVANAYEWLVETYEPGDEIFIFGFSRGAYTARSLAGLIALCGLLKPGSPLGVGQLFERYRRGDEDRTIWKLLAWEKAGELKNATLEERWMAAYAMAVPVKMVGVWDTVGALGVPVGKIPGLSRSGYAFLHTGLRIPIENAYHALAIDEHRKTFAPTLWTKKIRDGVPANAMAAPRPITSVEQRWFVGAHANVGGGYRSDLLAQVPLLWLMQKASSHGLTFRADVVLDPGVDKADLGRSYEDFLHGTYRFVSRPFQRVIGAPPEPSVGGHDETVNETIDASVFERWQANATYRPKNLTDWAQRHGADLTTLTGSVLAHAPLTAVA